MDTPELRKIAARVLARFRRVVDGVIVEDRVDENLMQQIASALDAAHACGSQQSTPRPKIAMLPGQSTPARVALAQVMEETKDTDTVFIVVVGDDEDVWVKSSHFRSHRLHSAASHLMAYGVQQALDSPTRAPIVKR